VLPKWRNIWEEIPVPEPISAITDEGLRSIVFSRKGIIFFG
jgi:hypothetical protein